MGASESEGGREGEERAREGEGEKGEKTKAVAGTMSGHPFVSLVLSRNAGFLWLPQSSGQSGLGTHKGHPLAMPCFSSALYLQR